MFLFSNILYFDVFLYGFLIINVEILALLLH
jgi:hypothetical protein